MTQSKSMPQKYSYQDYLQWPDEERWEIMEGVAYDMTPAPSVKHQRIIGKLFRKMVDRIEEKGCAILISPTDVVLDEHNVVQPDLLVVCDETKITEDNIKGAPDLIIEVISPSTSLKDKRGKKKLYEKFGVKEYLIVYPEDELVERFILRNDKYPASDIFNWDETMNIESLELHMNLWEIFGKERGKKEDEGGQQDTQEISNVKD